MRTLRVDDSSQIDSIVWDGTDMGVHFLNGAVYRYYNVPSFIFGYLAGAESVGKAFNAMKAGALSQYEKIAG